MFSVKRHRGLDVLFSWVETMNDVWSFFNEIVGLMIEAGRRI